MHVTFAFLLFPLLTYAVPRPEPEAGALDERQALRIAIEGFSYSGSGCPSNTVTHTLDPDGDADNLRFEAFKIAVGGNRIANPQRSASQDCAVRFRLRYNAAGCTAATFQVTEGGFSQVDPDVGSQRVTGSATARYSLAGGSATPSSQTKSLSYANQGGSLSGIVFTISDYVNTRLSVATAGTSVTFQTSVSLSLQTPNTTIGGVMSADNLTFRITKTSAC